METRMDKMRKLANELLILIREEKAERGTNSTGGGRELSLAVAKFEEGCMWMIRSNFSEKEYSPLLKLQEVKE